MGQAVQTLKSPGKLEKPGYSLEGLRVNIERDKLASLMSSRGPKPGLYLQLLFSA